MSASDQNRAREGSGDRPASREQRCQDRGNHVTGIDTRFVLQLAQFLLRNVCQLCLSVFFLILIKRRRRRDFERVQGVLVEVDRTENCFVWECHSLKLPPFNQWTIQGVCASGKVLGTVTQKPFSLLRLAPARG